MFSYRLKSIKQPCAFCCEKVNKPVYLGQLSSYSSSKKRALASSPFSWVLTFSFRDLFCNVFLLVESGKTLSAKMHTREIKAVLLCCCGGDFPRAMQSHASKRETCTHQRLPDNTQWNMLKVLKNVDDAVCTFIGEIMISKSACFHQRRKGGTGRQGGICTLGCCFLPYCKR